ncbi:MAG: endolytic transglycosylase MltG [Patescibacteria group bacterium]
MKKALIFLFLITILIFGLSITAYFVGISISSSNQEDVTIIISDGQGVGEIAKEFKDTDLIKSELIFKAYLFINNKSSKIQPGEYIFKQVNIQKIVSHITNSPDAREELTLTFLEGWTANEMSALLEENSIVFRKEFLDLVDSIDTRIYLPNKYYDFLNGKPLNTGIEGFLFPDTYRIYQDAKPEEIIEKMLDNFNAKYNTDLQNAVVASNMKLFDVITLASIVEKEARTKDDKNMVAGIFLNRLAIRQRLQSDATINYITGKKTDRPNSQDLDQESLYNTYKYSDLPPGPICNPGLDAINAVVHPTESDYMYFLNTPGGDIVYSRTYDEHLAKKNKYYK